MTVRRHHTGSGRRSVIPADWSAHHRPIVEDTFDADCEIRRPGDTGAGVLDPITGKTTRAPHAPHYSGPCTVHVLDANEREAITGDQEVTTVAYRVTIATIAAPLLAVDDLIKVTGMADNGDLTLVGRSLKVQSFARGSASWERDINCVDDLG